MLFVLYWQSYLHGHELVNHSEYRLGTNLPYGKSYETTALGFRMNIHLYYDPEKALRESEALYELLEAQENDLKGMEEPPDKKLHYDKYFYINRSKDGKLGYRRNYRAVDEALRGCGYFMIAETDFKKSTAEILEIYRRRDVVEKSFDNLKNELDMKRMRSHSSETAQGKLFAAFLSLIVQASYCYIYSFEQISVAVNRSRFYACTFLQVHNIGCVLGKGLFMI